MTTKPESSPAMLRVFPAGLRRVVAVLVLTAGAAAGGLALRDGVRRMVPWGARVTFYHGEDFRRPVWWTGRSSLEFVAEGRPAPLVRSNHFSCRWEGWLEVPETATYVFHALNDDGLRLFLDGRLVIDNWQVQRFHGSGRSVTLPLEKGRRAIRVDYFDARDLARFRVEWTGGPIPPKTIIAAPYLRKWPSLRRAP